MKCNVYLKIGDESILIIEGMDSSLIPSEINEEFLNLIKNSGKIDFLKEKLEQNLLEGITEKQITGIRKDDLSDYQIANTTAKEISLNCPPSIKFPDIDLSKVKVKLVDRFENYGSNIIVKPSPNGEPVYILDGNPATIRKFARHLQIEDAINHQVLEKLDKNSKELKTIDKILEKAKIKYPKQVKDRQSLLRHYIKNKTKYNKITIFSEGEDSYTASVLLDEILPLIENIYYPKNNNYSSPLIRNLHGPGGITYDKGKPQISYNDLYNILSGSLDLSMFKSQKEFNDSMKSFDKSEQIIKFFGQFKLSEQDLNPEQENYDILFQQIFSTERGYPYSYSRITKEGIIKFKSNYYSLEENYGLSYDTIISLDKSEYKGWKILRHQLDDENAEYFISQYEFQPGTKGKAYSSKKEAKAAIDIKLSEQSFKSSFFIQLYQDFDKINTYGTINVSSKSNSLQKGNVIRIPRISLPDNIKMLDARENIIFGESTIDDFKDVIKLWPWETQELLFDKEGNLIKDIDNIQKAGVFLALLNVQYENRERTPEIINNVLEQIREANKHPIYLYVEDSNIIRVPRKNKITKEILKDKQGNILYNEIKQLKVVKIPNPESVSDIDIQKNGFQYPIISFWEETAKTLNNVFGTKINILTQSEIEDQFGTRYSGEKAFIIGDNVYINSTIGSMEDLLHEYIHIIMGYLKVNNPEVYSQLLQQVWKYTNNEDKKNINRNYKEDSYISKLEENFVKQFSKYIYNQGETKLDEIFSSSELEKAFDTIFDKSDFNLKELGKHELSEIFNRFSSEISMALQKYDKLFGKFASSEEFRLNNKKTNLLQKWIKEGRIREFNCR